MTIKLRIRAILRSMWRITLADRGTCNPKGGGEQRIFCTLLHEMLHAFLHSYVCRRSAVRKESISLNADMELLDTGNFGVT
jgi:hypothetical protein